MKLNSLASAVSISLAALALTACGGNDSSATASVTPAPAPKPIETPKPVDPNTATTPNKEGDTSSLPNNPNSSVTTVNTLIANFDAAKTVSSGSTSYIRKDDANYDYSANTQPINTGRMAAGLAGDLNDQNPYLSNYLIGAELDSSGKIIGNDYLGAVVEGTVGVRGTARKVRLADEVNGTFTTKTLEGTVENNSVQLTTGDIITAPASVLLNSVKAPNNIDLRYSIQDVNKDHVAVSDTALNKLSNEAIRTPGSVRVANRDFYGDTGLVGYTANTSPVGETSAFNVSYGRPENDAGAKFKDYDKVVDAYIVMAQNLNDVNLRVLSEKGIMNPDWHVDVKQFSADDKSMIYNTKPTRVFGKNYKDYSGDAGVKDATTGKVKNQLKNNYANSYQATDKLNAEGKLELLTARSMELVDVQYGRLTSNIDAIAQDLNPNVNELYYRAFVNAATPGSVDVYYARGTNSTTLDQMNAVKTAAKGGKLEYRGHALTYGIAPNATVDADALKNSFGRGKEISTFGNFVHATYDTAANKLNGNIYNFINSDVTNSESKYYRNDLLSFGGDVAGNTVVNGKATYKDQTGSFAASFYGDAAQELGGQISSVADGYGAAKWGAVFGAQKIGGANSNQEINQQKK